MKMPKLTKREAIIIIAAEMIVVVLLIQIQFMYNHQNAFEIKLDDCKKICYANAMDMEGVTYELECVCKPYNSTLVYYYFT